MAGSNVNVYTTNWQYTGANVSMAQASFDVSINWIDENGQEQSWADTVVWPNDLAFLSVAQRKAIVEEITYRVLRVRLGIDGDV